MSSKFPTSQSDVLVFFLFDCAAMRSDESVELLSAALAFLHVVCFSVPNTGPALELHLRAPTPSCRTQPHWQRSDKLFTVIVFGEQAPKKILVGAGAVCLGRQTMQLAQDRGSEEVIAMPLSV